MVFRKVLLALFVIFIAAPVFFLGFFLIFPDISRFKTYNPEKTSFMEYREREWRRKGEKRTIKQFWAPLQKMSPYVISAVIISEDDNFWTHNGFDFEAIKSAYRKNLERKEFRYGGSTITQQLAKNLYLTPSKTPVRKIIETILTWRLERTLTKKRILELYLNVVEWGNGIFGIEAASRHYFGKSASALGPMEAARLAVILPNPRRYRLDGSSRYIEKRSRIIYTRMLRRGNALPETAEEQEDSLEMEMEAPDTVEAGDP